MIYKEYKGKELSYLGLGLMRLPVIDGDDSVIDEKASADMVAYAMEKGINYYDTAWGYHGGNSETVVGKILKEYPRDSFYLASKFPGYDLDNMDKVEEIFEKQLEKCQVDYFDFYMFHNVSEKNIDMYLDEKYGIFEYLMKQKENGRIRHLGFSTHGSLETMERFINAYGEHMEFCQIQLNWIDWTFQQAKEKVEMLDRYGIPVWVMEPVRGGSLASLPEEYAAKLKELRPEASVPEWAFRFLETIPSVKVVLSGMSNFQQLSENIATFEKAAPLDEKELELLGEIREEMISKKTLPCTACRYCVSYCPQKLDIPVIIEKYNEHIFTGGGFLAAMYFESQPEEKHPKACIGCGSCEEVCPQNIKISDAMADFAKQLGM